MLDYCPLIGVASILRINRRQDQLEGLSGKQLVYTQLPAKLLPLVWWKLKISFMLVAEERKVLAKKKLVQTVLL
jgi:hypothetical protein